MPVVQARAQLSNGGLAQHLMAHPMGEEMLQLDLIVQTWVLALDVWHLSQAGIAESDWQKYQGRGHIYKPKWMHIEKEDKDNLNPAQEALVWRGRLTMMLQQRRLVQLEILATVAAMVVEPFRLAQLLVVFKQVRLSTSRMPWDSTVLCLGSLKDLEVLPLQQPELTSISSNITVC